MSEDMWKTPSYCPQAGQRWRSAPTSVAKASRYLVWVAKHTLNLREGLQRCYQMDQI